ncbi:MAG: hypothetical protein QOE72_4299 [Chloroflexota bacterium]|nr:hypothetical protein [Chloroflexota bacterium]
MTARHADTRRGCSRLPATSVAGAWKPWKNGIRYDVWLPGEPRRRHSFYGPDHATVIAKAQEAHDRIVGGTVPLCEKDMAALVAEWLRTK